MSISKADQRRLDRLRARSERLLERGQAAEMRSRRLYEDAAEAEHELAELERSLGLRPPIAANADLAKVASIYKKIYSKAGCTPSRAEAVLAPGMKVTVAFGESTHDPDEPHGSHGFGARGRW